MSKGGLGATKLTEVSKTPKMDNETPAQKQAAAKLALRKQLEKTLLQVRNKKLFINPRKIHAKSTRISVHTVTLEYFNIKE